MSLNFKKKVSFYIALGSLLVLGFLWILLNGTPFPRWFTPPTQQRIAYLAPANSPEVVIHDLVIGETRTLTDTQGQVYDFDVSPDGKFIIYSQSNQMGGRDLVRINLTTEKKTTLTECGQSVCFEPAISPDGNQVAYTLQDAGRGWKPEVWVLALNNLSRQPLFEDPNISSAQARWSPQGDRLAVLDEVEEGIKVITISSGDIVSIPTGIAKMGTFSPDGSKILFLNTQINGIQSFQGVFEADFKDMRIKPFLAPDLTEFDYSVPAWSPEGDEVVVGWRTLVGLGRGSEQLSLFNAEGSDERIITTQQNYTHAAYSWENDGKRILFQQFEVGNTAAKPQVAIWEEGTNSITVIADDANFPRWIP